MGPSKKKATKAEQERLDAIHSLPCLACAQEMQAGKIMDQPWPTEAHHIVDKGYRKHSGGHLATLPLEAWHHRGVPRGDWGIDETLYHFGPSLAHHKKLFVSLKTAERRVELLGPEPWKSLQVNPDEKVCCSGYECACGGETWREHLLSVRNAPRHPDDVPMPPIEYIRIEKRRLSPWEPA